MITVIGFPLKQHMTSRLSRSCHRTLAQWGPTDGTTSLSDLVGWPGDVYPAWGMDHYFRPEAEARNLIAAVLRDLIEYPSSTERPARQLTGAWSLASREPPHPKRKRLD
jgi:hypothetical protein